MPPLVRVGRRLLHDRKLIPIPSDKDSGFVLVPQEFFESGLVEHLPPDRYEEYSRLNVNGTIFGEFLSHHSFHSACVSISRFGSSAHS